MEKRDFQTISQMFLDISEQYKDKIAYGYKENSEWKNLTFGEVRNYVKEIHGGLRFFGLSPKEHVGIVSENSHWWAMADYGTICAQGVVTTIYPTLTVKQMKWIILHSESKYLFCGTMQLAEKILTIIGDLHNVRRVIVMNNDNDSLQHPKFISMQELIEKGRIFIDDHPDDFEKDVAATEEDDLLTLIYTSGTTGEPKGVMLTHRNLAENIKASLEVLEVYDSDTLLSFLPLSHSFERMAGHFLPFSKGAKICYAENLLKVAENMTEVCPTLMVSVPRLYEKIYSRIIDNIAKASFIKKKLFWWAIKVGKKGFHKRNNQQPIGFFLRKKLNLADKLVFNKLKARIGGRLRFFVSGGAPLSKEIGEFFNGAGVIIIEGYGLTETSPVISVNPMERNKIGAVGLPLSNCKVKIAPDGEILMQGPNLMQGYFKDPVATDDVIDSAGWFHTGDIGDMDEEGYLRITDRKKNILVTAGGKNVAPQPMENVLVTSKWIEQILIIGDKRKFIAALIVPSFPNLEEWAQEQGLQWSDREELVQLPQVKALYARTINESMEGFAQFEKVKKFILLPSEFTIEGGELTPSLKIRRKIVLNKYSDLIDSIYSNRK